MTSVINSSLGGGDYPPPLSFVVSLTYSIKCTFELSSNTMNGVICLWAKGECEGTNVEGLERYLGGIFSEG